MSAAMSDIAKIGGGLLLSIAKAIGLVLFSVALFFITRYIQKNSKKQKSFTIEAAILDMNGILDFDKIGFTKSEKTGLLEMQFQKRKSDSMPPIPKHLVKNNMVLLLNYAPGHYTVLDTYSIVRDLEKFNELKFKFYNLGMKKYLMDKQRELLNKLEEKKLNFEKYSPWIVLGISILGVIVLAALLFYLGVKLEANNISQRIAECQLAGYK